MNQYEFEKVIDEQFNYIKELLMIKGDEYEKEQGDRLAYFKTAAGVMGRNPKEALAGMMLKHTISIYTMCKSDKRFGLDKWTEKITDHMNYLLLLKALVIEERNELVGVDSLDELKIENFRLEE